MLSFFFFCLHLLLHNLVTWQLYLDSALKQYSSSIWFLLHLKSVFLWNHIKDWVSAVPGLGVVEAAGPGGFSRTRWSQHSLHPSLANYPEPVCIPLCLGGIPTQCGNGPWLQIMPLTRFGETEPFTVTSSMVHSSLQPFPFPSNREK